MEWLRDSLQLPQIKANCQIFIKNDLLFYRTDYVGGYNILLKIRKEKEDQEYIDFRINNAGRTISIIEDKELQLCPSPKKEQSKKEKESQTLKQVPA